MKLKECLELGKECGLTTWEDCYVNVDLHAMCIFKYDEINKELLELQKDMFAINPDKFCEIFDCTKEDLINKGWKINKQVTVDMVGNSEDTAVNLIHKVMNGKIR